MGLRFHWMLPKGGEVALQTANEMARYRAQSADITSPARNPDVEGWRRFARTAEEAGIESVLISCGRYEPDALLTACALGRETEKLKYIVASRTGWMQPTTFVQQINTLSALIDGRVAVNIVAGSSSAEQHAYGDFLEHDQRYERAEEFLAVCNSFWRGDGNVDLDGEYYRVEGGKLATPFLAPDRSEPEIYVSGHSESAQKLACSQATCWVRVVDTPEKLGAAVARVREQGVDVCLRLGLVCRDTRDEAVAAAKDLLPDDYVGKKQPPIAAKNDSQMYREATRVAYDAGWLNRTLWAGLVPYYGPVWTSLVGTPDELARALLDYKAIGVSQFIISGCPEIDAVERFGREILPSVRNAERNEQKQIF
jgi:alkanesulfonate monooxygenase